ncbi:MAG: putative metal-binding motif-containing protein [Deltaproteobacteria bacterium]|nr:putative metal-binding motif-containing protein [Deltaproteobacteria bacterium]
MAATAACGAGTATASKPGSDGGGDLGSADAAVGDAAAGDGAATDAQAADQAGADQAGTDTASADSAADAGGDTAAGADASPDATVDADTGSETDAVADTAADTADTAADDVADAGSAPDTADGGDTSSSPDAAGDTAADVPVVEKQVGGAVGFAVNVLDAAAKLSAKVYVTNEDGQAIAGAEVVVGGKVFPVAGSTATLTDISVSASPVMTVRAAGYASSALILDPLRAMNGVTVQLRKFAGSKAFPAALGGTLQVPSASITLDSEGVVGPGGKPYTGTVTVAAVASEVGKDLLEAAGGISPEAAARLPDPVVMVANAAGTAKTASLKLASLHVALTGAAGEELQPAPGKPALVDFALDGGIAAAFPGAYTAGAKLDVASRNETTGAWSVSGQCTVANGPNGWSCKAALPHFSEAAVTTPEKEGCLVVESLDLTIAEGEAVTWRTQRLKGAGTFDVAGHFYDNGGKLGLCAIVPLDLENVRVEVEYQTGPAGSAVTAEPNYAGGMSTATLRKFLGKPSDQKLSQIANLDKNTAAGCLAACGAAPKQKVVLPLAPKPVAPSPDQVITPPKPSAPPTFDVVDMSKVDLDKDGAPASLDCDDGNPVRAPGKADPCGDGIDQNCDGSDSLCPLVCMQAAIKCMGPCLGSDESPKTPKQLACIGTCQTAEPFVSTEQSQAWTSLQSCIAACTTSDCVGANCGDLFGACMGSAPDT